MHFKQFSGLKRFRSRERLFFTVGRHLRTVSLPPKNFAWALSSISVAPWSREDFNTRKNWTKRACMFLEDAGGVAWENSRHLATLPLVHPAKWRLRNERRNSILMTRHYPDLGSASDWSCRMGNLIQPIRSSTQIWVVTRHQYGNSALLSQTSFDGETSGSVAKCWLFSRATGGEVLTWV